MKLIVLFSFRLKSLSKRHLYRLNMSKMNFFFLYDAIFQRVKDTIYSLIIQYTTFIDCAKLEISIIIYMNKIL